MPVLLQTAMWFRKAQWYLDQCHRRFGDMFTMEIAVEGKWVVTADPDVVKQVFTGDPRTLHAGEANKILEPILGANSVLCLDDGPHLRQRKLMLPSFHGERMQRYGDLMAGIAATEIDSWPDDSVQHMRGRMQAVTLEIILHAVFGITEGPRQEGLRTHLRELLDAATKPLTGLALITLGPSRIGHIGPLARRMQAVDALLYEEIAERRGTDTGSRSDVLSMLLDATHDDVGSAGDAGGPMTDEELRDELMTLLVAGHETTANSLAWAVERLIRHPDKLARLTDEVRAGETAYLQAVVQETLRLRPVISIVLRKLKEPMEFGGWLLPEGVSIVPSIYLIHRRPDIYPDPEAFKPERFIERPPGTYTWIPFGGGVRRCLGAAFAQYEMEVVLRELVLRRSLAPVRPEAETVLRRAITETPNRDGEVRVGACPFHADGRAAEAEPAEALVS